MLNILEIEMVLSIVVLLILNTLIVAINFSDKIKIHLEGRRNIINVLPVILFPIMLLIIGVEDYEKLILFCQFYFLGFFLFYSILIISLFGEKIFIKDKLIINYKTRVYFWVSGIFFIVTFVQAVYIIAFFL